MRCLHWIDAQVRNITSGPRRCIIGSFWGKNSVDTVSTDTRAYYHSMEDLDILRSQAPRDSERRRHHDSKPSGAEDSPCTGVSQGVAVCTRLQWIPYALRPGPLKVYETFPCVPL